MIFNDDLKGRHDSSDIGFMVRTLTSVVQIPEAADLNQSLSKIIEKNEPQDVKYLFVT